MVLEFSGVSNLIELLENRRPKKPRIILVEGWYDVGVFGTICKQENLYDVIQLIPYAEVGTLRRFLDSFVRDENFKLVERIGLTKDADTDPAAARRSLEGAWQGAQIALGEIRRAEPVYLFFVLPDDRNPGRIETLCIQAPTFPPVLECAEQTFDCVTAAALGYGIDREKSIVAAYLSMMKESGLRLGTAAEAGYWDLRGNVFEPLREFIRRVGR